MIGFFLKRRAFSLLALALLSPLAQAQDPNTCVVSGYIFGLDEQPAAAGILTIVKVEQNGGSIPFTSFSVAADPNGLVTFAVPRNCEVWVEGNFIQGLNRLGGVPLRIPDAATARLELLWQLPDGVTSLNGRTGDLNLSNSDITAALGFSPVSPASVISALNTSIEPFTIQDSKLSVNVARLNASNAFQDDLTIGATSPENARLTVRGANLPGSSATTIRKGPSATSALDIYTDNTGPEFQFGLRIFTPESPPDHQPRSFFNTAGAFYSNAWMVISGHVEAPGAQLDSRAYYIKHPSSESFMLGLWSDVYGPALQVRGSGGKDTGSYLFSGLDAHGYTTFLVEEDGEHRWGAPWRGIGEAPTTRATTDTNLYRTGVAALKTDGNLTVARDFRAEGDIVGKTYRLRSLTRTLPAGTNTAVALGDFTMSPVTATMSFVITVVVANPGNSVAKQYSFPVQYNQAPAGTWLTALPTSSTGNYEQNDFHLDVKVAQTLISLRLRNSGAIGQAYITIQHEGSGNEQFAPSTATTAATVPAQFYSTTVMSQTRGAVGVGTSSPAADALIDLNGGDEKGLRLRPRSTAGAPLTGNWSMGTMIIDSTGVLYICTRSGVPGTWRAVGNQH
jgi:hypothetical protein